MGYFYSEYDRTGINRWAVRSSENDMWDESTWNTKEEAADRCHWLNGGERRLDLFCAAALSGLLAREGFDQKFPYEQIVQRSIRAARETIRQLNGGPVPSFTST